MLVTVLSSENKQKYIDNLFENIDRNYFSLTNYNIEDICLDKQVENKVKHSEMLILLIDNVFIRILESNKNLKESIEIIQNNENKIFIPIIFDNAITPEFQVNGIVFYCNSNTNYELVTIRQYIKNKIYAGTKFSDLFKKSLIGHKFHKQIVLLIILNIFCSITLIILGELNWNLYPVIQNKMLKIYLICNILSALITLLYLSIIITTSKNNKEIETYSQKLEKAVISEKSNEVNDNTINSETKIIDAIKHMNLNLENIKKFYTWSQHQAVAAFILAVTLCILGFGLIFCSILLPLIYDLDLEMSIIPGIGGAVVEVIAGTALVIYQRSLSQLNHYHRALHEDERFLSSINLLNKFSTKELQDEILKEIIQSEIRMNIIEAEKDIRKNDNAKT